MLCGAWCLLVSKEAIDQDVKPLCYEGEVEQLAVLDEVKEVEYELERGKQSRGQSRSCTHVSPQGT